MPSIPAGYRLKWAAGALLMIWRKATIPRSGLQQAKMMYLSIPYDGGWRLKVDGQETAKQIVFAGMTGVLLTPGQHIIEMTYQLRYFSIGVILSIAGLLALGAVIIIQRRKSGSAMSAPAA